MKIAKLYKDAVIPTRKHKGDAGLDLYCYLVDEEGPAYNYVVEPNAIVIFKTGITVEIPLNYFGWIANKSKKDYLIGGGIIDETYQGELLVKVINTSGEILYFSHGDAIAQLLIIPCIHPEIELVDMVNIHKTRTSRSNDGGIVRQQRLIG